MVNTLVNLMNNNNINIKPYNILLLELLSFVDEPLAKSKSISESEVIKEDEIKINSSPLSNVEPAHRKLDNNLDKIIEIRVNNCFVNAKKVYLDDMKNKIKKIIDNLEGAKKIRNILLDTVLVAASDEYLIFSSDNNHVAMNYNENLKKIEEELYNLLLIKYKIIFISSSRWQTEKLSYVNNLKNNKKYIIIEEKELLTKNSEIEKLADDLFDKNKLEII